MNIVTGAMGSLIPKLGKLLMDEYNLHKSIKKDVEFLRKELEGMHAALAKVGEVPRDQLDKQVKLWADEVRELSYDMEDVVDKFLVRVDGIEHHDNTNRFNGLMKKMADLFKKGKNHHRIADAIKEIKEQLHEVAARRDRNKVDGIPPNPTTVTIDPRLRALYTEATELVGIYGKRDQGLLRLLSIEDGDASSKRLKKISIVGFGGLGKTTLARAVYKKIKCDFACKAFVSIGRNPDIKKIFRDILVDLDNSISNLAILDERQLINKLLEVLDNKRYLIITDDIWDESLWKNINVAFSNRNNLGSRIITTTRIFNVSESCCSSADDSIYQMEPLSIDDSRRLFYKRIFPGESGCPNELEQVSKEILKKCGGVPLAIITIASALASGQQVKPKHEWDVLLQSIGSGLTEDNSLEEMRRILSFSYYDLPSYLKTCLLYLCIYPEDCMIYRDRLIWKWVAEGFVHHGNQGTSQFLLGLNYFNQLINRSMIQPIYDRLGMIYACRVHDMVLDLICNLSHEAMFVNLLDDTGNSISSQSKVRRLSLQNKNEDHQAKPLTNIINGVLQNLASIEVLKVSLVSLSIIAQELGDLARLRDLRILFKDGSLDLYEGFVKSLCNLHRIKSLSIDCYSREAPSYELMDLLGERWVPPGHLCRFLSHKPIKLSALQGWIKRDPSHLSNLSELSLMSVKDVQQQDVEIIGELMSLRLLQIKSTHQTQRLLVIRADGFRCMVVFDLNCGSAAQIIFEPGALPRAEAVRFSLGVRMAKEDGNCGFNLGLQGNLAVSLRQYLWVYMYVGGVRVGEAKEAWAAVRHTLDAHPNLREIRLFPHPPIAEGAHDDDLLCDSDEES